MRNEFVPGYINADCVNCCAELFCNNFSVIDGEYYCHGCTSKVLQEKQDNYELVR